MEDRFRQWYVQHRQQVQTETTAQSTAQYRIVFALYSLVLMWGEKGLREPGEARRVVESSLEWRGMDG
jgi:hypothetical protein